MLRGAEAADHQKHLHDIASRIRQPVKEHRRQWVGHIGERAVETEVMPDEQIRGDCPQPVNGTQPLRNDNSRRLTAGFCSLQSPLARRLTEARPA